MTGATNTATGIPARASRSIASMRRAGVDVRRACARERNRLALRTTLGASARIVGRGFPLEVRRLREPVEEVAHDGSIHFGTERYTYLRHDYVHYRFFDDPIAGGRDAIFGLDPALMHLVDIFKSAAQGYGTDRRILLLHGPVGSSKSTIARLLKKGLEHYSRLDQGALYTFSWKNLGGDHENDECPCPMHEDPLKLIPPSARQAVLSMLNADLPEDKQVRVEGDLDPLCRRLYTDLLLK